MVGAGETAQQLKEYTGCSSRGEDPGSIPNTHVAAHNPLQL